MASSTVKRPASGIHLPPSPGVAEPYRLTPQLALRLAILGVVVLAVFAALFLRLWALQVLQGSQYLRTAENNQLRTVRIPAARGPILDRNRTPLVTNAAATAIEIWPADLPKVYTERYRELRRLARASQVPLYQIAAAIKARADNPLTPVTVKAAAHEDLVTYLAEHRDEFPGITTTQTYIRHYPYQSLAAQVLGYVTEISPAQLKAADKQVYRAGDDVGQSGVEASYDSWLRGKPGAAQLRVDSLGRPRSDLQLTRNQQPGHALRLTIDLKVQQAAERALAYGIRLAVSQGHWAARGGAIVALDPRNGAIVAMASAPTYKPSVYAGRTTNRELAAQGLTAGTALRRNYPALNRALTGTYPPGSTFKPVTALAAMEEHLISPYSYLPCTGSYTSPNDQNVPKQVFHNWDPFVNQSIDLPTALAESCDTYFYALGDRFYEAAGSPLKKWAANFGFGKLTHIDVGPEAKGLVPDPRWRRRTYTRRTDPCCWAVDRLWKPGDSIQLAIGQKDLLVTPLQLARFYALIANGGKLVTPHLLYDIENPNGTAVPVPALPAPQQTTVDAAALAVVRKGLWEATHLPFGTSYGVFGGFPVAIAGKTGTAEKQVTLPGFTGLQDQSWWCGFGPYNDPKLVVCALIENAGHGGTAAAPAAAKVFEQYFHLKALRTGTIHSD
ncbi:MAG: penicillin-binding protein 2 [Gaiellaceae bacterium]